MSGMPEKPIIWIVDTVILLNVLDVPGKNQDRGPVLRDFQTRIERGDTLLLPFGAIIETGNHIACLTSGNHRREYAQKFSEQVKKAIKGESPWIPLNFPKREDMFVWLDDFPSSATRQLSLVDHSIIKEWEEQCQMYKKKYQVRIWSLDGGLVGYECNG